MELTFADILENCLLQIDAGASVDDCLDTYPQQRDALEAPLRAAAQLRALPRPALPAATRAALETRMLALAAQRRAMPTTSSNDHSQQPAPHHLPAPVALLAGILRTLGYRGSLTRPWLRLAAMVIAVILAVALGTGAFAAARAIVRAIQGPPVTPTVTIPAATPFALDGPIEQIAAQRWMVKGTVVVLESQTTITGTVQLGAVAHVRGALRADATLLAHTITIDAQPIAPTSAPIPPTSPPRNTAPTAIPMPPVRHAPDGSDEDESDDKPKPDKPKPDKPKPDKPKPDKPKPNKPDKPKPDKPSKPDKPGKGKDKGDD